MLAALPFFWQAPSSSGAAVLLVGGSAGWLFLSPLRREPVTSGAVHSHGDDPGRAARSLGPPARRWRPVGRLATSHHRGDPGRQRVPVAVAPGDLQQLSGFSVGRADRDGGGDRPRMARGDARPAPVGPALARARAVALASLYRRMAIPGDAPGHELFGIDLTALEPGASLAGPHGRRGAPLGGVADRARLGGGRELPRLPGRCLRWPGEPSRRPWASRSRRRIRADVRLGDRALVPRADFGAAAARPAASANPTGIA